MAFNDEFLEFGEALALKTDGKQPGLLSLSDGLDSCFSHSFIWFSFRRQIYIFFCKNYLER